MSDMRVSERVQYLKGLMEGMKLDTESDQGKILSLMADVIRRSLRPTVGG